MDPFVGQRAEVAGVRVRVIGNDLHEYLLPRTVYRAVCEHVQVLVLGALAILPARAGGVERKHLVAVLDSAHVSAERIVLARIGHLGLEAAVRVGQVDFAHPLSVAAIRVASPEFDSRTGDGLAGLRAVDRPLELAVAGLEHERERRHRDVLREKRQLVCAELLVRSGVKDVVARLGVRGNRQRELL